MAYVVSSQTVEVEGTPTSVTIALPPHVTNDLLIYAVAQDNAVAAWTAPAGWTRIDTFGASGGSGMQFFYKVATGSGTTDPVQTGIADDWVYWVAVIRDADTTTPIDVTNRTDWNAVGSVTSGAPTTTAANDLVLVGICADSNTQTVCRSGLIPLGAGNTASAIMLYVGCYTKATAGTLTGVTFDLDQADEGGNVWTVAIKNKTNGKRMPNYADATTTIDTLTFTAGGRTFVAPNVDYTTIDGTGVDTGVTLADIAQTSDPYRGVSYCRLGSAANGPLWAGGTLVLGSAINLTNAIVSFLWRYSSMTHVGAQGNIVVFKDGGGNWVAYTIARKVGINSTPSTYTTHIAVGAGTALASSGTMDWSNVTRISFLYMRAVSVTLMYIEVALLGYSRPTTSIFTGGSDASPVSWGTIAQQALGFRSSQYGRVGFQGVGQLVGKHHIQLGDGTIPTYVDLNGQSFESERPYDPAAGYRWWNVPDFSLSVTMKASATCTMLVRNCVFAPATPSTFTIDAASNVAATVDFGGSLFSNMNWSDNAGYTIDGAIFSRCHSVQGVAGTSFQSCSFEDGHDPQLLLMAAGGEAQGCSFTAASAGQYGVRIDTAGDYYLEDSTFAVSTTDIYVAATTGTVTIHLALGQTVPTYTTDGATVVISQPVVQAEIDISGAVSGSRIMVRNETTDTEVYNAIATGYTLSYDDGTTFTAGDSYSVTVTYYNGTSAKLPIVYTGIASSAGFTIVVNQENDTVYNTHAIDGSLQTGITFNSTSIDIDLDGSVDPAVYWKDIYARYIYVTHTLTGIRDFVGTVFAVDLVNFQFSSAIVFNNLNAIPVRIGGDGYGKRLDGGSMFGSGNLQIDNGVGALAVETGVSGLTAAESAKLLSLDTTNLDVAVSTVPGLVWDEVLETGFSADRILRVTAAAVAGKSSGGPGNFVARNLGDTQNQISGAADVSGNRTSATYGA